MIRYYTPAYAIITCQGVGRLHWGLVWEPYVYKYHPAIGFSEESGPASFCLLWNSGRKPGEMSSDCEQGSALVRISGHKTFMTKDKLNSLLTPNCLCTEQILIPNAWLVQTGARGRTLQTIPGHTPLIAPIEPALTFVLLSQYWESESRQWLPRAPAVNGPNVDIVSRPPRGWRGQQQQLERVSRWHHYSISPLSIIPDEIEIAGRDPNLIRGTQTYSQENRV